MIRVTAELFRIIPVGLKIEHEWITREFPTWGFDAGSVMRSIKSEFPQHTIAAFKYVDIGQTCSECVHFELGYCNLPQRKNDWEPRNHNAAACAHFYDGDEAPELYSASVEDEF